jgi:hypothetical protein
MEEQVQCRRDRKSEEQAKETKNSNDIEAEKKANITTDTSDLPAHSHDEAGHRVTRTAATNLDLVMQVIKEATMAHDLVDRRLRGTCPASSVLVIVAQN